MPQPQSLVDRLRFAVQTGTATRLPQNVIVEHCRSILQDYTAAPVDTLTLVLQMLLSKEAELNEAFTALEESTAKKANLRIQNQTLRVQVTDLGRACGSLSDQLRKLKPSND